MKADRKKHDKQGHFLNSYKLYFSPPLFPASYFEKHYTHFGGPFCLLSSDLWFVVVICSELHRLTGAQLKHSK